MPLRRVRGILKLLLIGTRIIALRRGNSIVPRPIYTVYVSIHGDSISFKITEFIVRYCVLYVFFLGEGEEGHNWF